MTDIEYEDAVKLSAKAIANEMDKAFTKAVTVDTNYMDTYDIKQSHAVSFHNSEGELVGELDFNTHELKFKGNAEESAQVFINWVKMKWELEK